MHVHISYKVHKTPDIEKEINHLLEKLSRRLRTFRPELVHLKGLIEQNSSREGAVVSLNLRLPSGQIAAQESAPSALGALKAASDDLILQIGKHKDVLRSSHKWRRRRGSRNSVNADSMKRSPISLDRDKVMPSLAASSSSDIRAYVNAHLGRLERFIERELYFREAAGQMNFGSVTKDEVVVRSLGEAEERHDGLALEPWLYRLAIQSISNLTSRASQGTSDVRLDLSAHEPDVTASDETELEFYQPDEFISQSDVIADSATATPEDIAYTDELMSLVHSALEDVVGSEREIFVLHALEGFSVVEIAAITDRNAEDIRSSIGSAREKLRRSATIRNGFKEKHLPRTGTD